MAFSSLENFHCSFFRALSSLLDQGQSKLKGLLKKKAATFMKTLSYQPQTSKNQRQPKLKQFSSKSKYQLQATTPQQYIMQVFDINNSQMTDQDYCVYQKLSRKFHEYYFEYPERRSLNLHESHMNENTLMGIRIVAFVYLSGIYFWALIQMATLNTNLIFLTLLGYTATWLYFGLSLQDVCINKANQPLSQSLHKVIEIIHQIAICTQVPITLVFWTLLFKIVLDMPNITTSEIVLQGNLHAVPLIFLILDFTHSTFSFPTRHISLIVVFMVIYLIINMTYSLCVKPIYQPIPWTDIASYIICLGCILMVLLIHFVARLIFRRWKLKKLEARQEIARSFLTKSDGFNPIDEESGKENSTFRKSVDL